MARLSRRLPFAVLCGLAVILPAQAATPAAVQAGTMPANAKASAPVAQTGPDRAPIQAMLASITLPPGFAIRLYALVPGARAMAVARDGTVFVGTNGDAVYRVTPPAAGTNLPTVTRFAPAIAMTMPHGVCLAPDRTLYVVEQNRVLAFADAVAKAAAPDLAAQVVVARGHLIPAAEESSNHSSRVCRIGPDGKLYLTIGQPFNVPSSDKQALYAKVGMGAILAIDRDGANRTIFASGIRNAVGLDFNPADGTLWFTDNQVDMMGDDIPPGELNRATRPGQTFGFPWYGGGHVRTYAYSKSPPPKDAVFPQIEMVAHAADLGMTFYRGTLFPPPYRGGIFSAQHGSWNRTVPVGARVMFTRLKPDGTGDATAPFAEGWKRADGSYAGRPADVAEMPDGTLLVSDDDAEAIYQITYTAP